MDPAVPMQDVSPSDGRDWTTDVVQLLEDWHKRCYAAQHAHYATANMCRLLNYLIGVPAVIFASVVGTAVFADLADDTPRRFAIASVSILAAVLAALQTFLRFSERAASHATAGDWYSAIRRDIEETLHLSVEYRGSAKDCLDTVRKEINRVAQDSPELSVRAWQREAKRFGVTEPLELP